MPTINLQPIHKDLVESYLVALAHFQLLDNMAAPFRKRALQVINPEYSDTQKERHGDKLGPLTWDRLYKAKDADAQNVYDYYNVITDDLLKWDVEGRCPVLIAQTNLNNVTCQIIEEFKGLTGNDGPTYEQLLVAGDKVLNEYIDLLVRLTVSHFKIVSSEILLSNYLEGV